MANELSRSLSDTINSKVNDAVAKKADKLNDAVARQAEKVAKKADKVAQQTARHLDNLDRLTAHLEALELWTRVEPGTRKPRLTREDIAATAIRVADAEGFDTVSMRRLAAELDAGTMTLYHYVRTKDELLALVIDELMSELIVPADEMPTEWRAAVTMIAHRSRSMLQRHRWVLDISDDPNLGPNSVRHFDQSMQAVSSLDIGLREKLDIITAVDEYVFGYSQHMRTNFHEEVGHAEGQMQQYVAELVASGEYPTLSAMVDEYGMHAMWSEINDHARDTTRFDRNLARLLDGIEADLARSS